ncbi:WYL domain-containing protein [Phytoactinopolyspora halotolerans]|uniref:WYL domain-containing protein n=1 Tax=Phytoactinopolyspora halotolerans TaxID=1981512 RepID=A0A6L9SGA9_9ACTN|nr:WYL domain-containing protein [Phytoactinopolyspora halotolerans]NEE03472.1 WYL domain-containing protein [Phytoactinopolyspora halotolerans]
MGRSLDRRRDADLVTEVRARLLSVVPASVRHDVERAVRNPVGAVAYLIRPRRRDSGPAALGPGGYAAAEAPNVAGMPTAARPDDAPAVHVVVTLHAPARTVGDHLDGIVDGLVSTVRPLDDERSRLEASYRGPLEHLAQCLLMLGFEFEVHEPQELSTALRVLSARALRAARDDVDLIWDGR